MKTERELFEAWFSKYLGDNHNAGGSHYVCAWSAWQASAKRDGFILVPVCRFCSGHGEVGCRFEGTHPALSATAAALILDCWAR